MPCMKCSNGKWKYGEHGKCVFTSESKCEDAAAAIHINDKNKFYDDEEDYRGEDANAEYLKQFK